MRARALWERAANGIRGKVDRQSPHLFSPRGTGERTLSPACEDGRIAPSVAAVPVFPLRVGRRGRRPLHAQSAGSRFHGRRLPHLRESLFGGWKLPSLYNGGEILKRGYPPLEAFQLGRVTGGGRNRNLPLPCVVLFPPFSWTSKRKGINAARRRAMRPVRRRKGK